MQKVKLAIRQCKVAELLLWAFDTNNLGIQGVWEFASRLRAMRCEGAVRQVAHITNNLSEIRAREFACARICVMFVGAANHHVLGGGLGLVFLGVVVSLVGFFSWRSGKRMTPEERDRIESTTFGAQGLIARIAGPAMILMGPIIVLLTQLKLFGFR
jgi:hypothetical protein